METNKLPIGGGKKQTSKYASLDFLRGFAAIGVVLCHIIANISVKPDYPFLLSSNIGKMAWFTLLFMMVSGFSMCCGYYDRVKNSQISLDKFYGKRFLRIWPLFAMVVLVECLYEHNAHALYETFADLSLAFALFPNPDISVCGVGWFIGVVFIFYMMFPYFVFLLWNKRRAWIVLLLSVLLHVVGTVYFYTDQFVVGSFVNKYNIIFCFPFFVTGGLIFLYKEKIIEVVRCRYSLFVLLAIVCLLSWVLTKETEPWFILSLIPIYASWNVLCIAKEPKIFCNKLTKFLSDISMEIYLLHMIVFRVVEKVHLENYIDNSQFLFVAYTIAVLTLVVVASWVTHFYILPKAEKLCSVVATKVFG